MNPQLFFFFIQTANLCLEPQEYTWTIKHSTVTRIHLEPPCGPRQEVFW